MTIGNGKCGEEIKVGFNVEEFVTGLEKHYDPARFEKF